MTRDYVKERGGIYRARDGFFLGVCKGLARHLDISVGWIRFLTIAIFFFSGFWPIFGLYFLAALIMKPEPVIPFETLEDREFYNSYMSSSRKGTLHRLKDASSRLDRRIRRIEDIVTTREYDWERRLNSNDT